MATVDSLLIGVDFADNGDVGVLIVGRKRPNLSVDIINAFQGEEAKRAVSEIDREEEYE